MPGTFLPDSDVANSKKERTIARDAQPPAIALKLSDPEPFRLGVPSAGEARLRVRGLARQAGVVRTAGVSADRLEYTQLPDGSRDGRLTVESKTAKRLRLRFVNFDAAGGRVWVYNADRSQVSGPYTDKGPFLDGDFWTEPINGERAIVEWAGLPSGRLTPAFEITEVAHLWPELEEADRSRADQDDPACHGSLGNASKAVASIDIVGDDGAVWFCTGTLLNTARSEYAPLFLTANHCVQNDREARTVAAVWNYAKTSCGKDEAAPHREGSPTTLGARFLSGLNTSQADFSILKLNTVPSGAFAMGWTVTEPAYNGKVMGVHHPGLPPQNYQRASFGWRGYDRNEILYIGEQYGDGMTPQNLYLQAYFSDIGVGMGSSGSALLNENGQVIGVASYCWIPLGDYRCTITDPVGYGRFSYFYPLVREFFENVPAPRFDVSARQFAFRTVDGVTQAPARQTVRITTDSATPVPWRFSAAQPWLAASTSSGIVSASHPATLEVFAAPPAHLAAGSYRTTATVSVGSAAPVILTADLTAEVQNPVITFAVAPNPVVEREVDRDGKNFDFRLELTETAGVEARMTLLVLDGQPYNASIHKFFGSDVLEAGGRLTAVISARLEPSASEDRVFEIGGYVPSTGRQWRATARAKFLPRPQAAGGQ